METKKEKEVIAEHFRALAKKSWEKRRKNLLAKAKVEKTKEAKKTGWVEDGTGGYWLPKQFRGKKCKK